MEKIFSIPDDNMQALTEKLAMLAKKAKKLRTSAIGYDIVGQEVKTVSWLDKSLDPMGERKTRDMVFHTLRVYGDVPVIHGYQFIATIDHVASDEGNIVSSVPDMCHENELISFRHVPPTCDHCHMSRKRNMTYVLRHVESGTYMRVGKNCLADFLRTTDALQIAASLETLLEVCDLVASHESYDGERGTRGTFMPLEEYLWHVSASIHADSWISATKARDSYDLVPTKTRAYDSWLGYARDSIYDVTPHDKERTQQALLWIRSLTESDLTSDYLYNLFTVCKGSVLSLRHMGIAASLFVAYDKAKNVAYEKKVTLPSNYVGTPGDKLTITVKILKETPIEGKYGMSYLYSMIDEKTGNKFKWFSSNPVLADAIDTTVTLSGTIKTHEEYQGVKSTMLTRCKVK